MSGLSFLHTFCDHFLFLNGLATYQIWFQVRKKGKVEGDKEKRNNFLINLCVFRSMMVEMEKLQTQLLIQFQKMVFFLFFSFFFGFVLFFFT